MDVRRGKKTLDEVTTLAGELEIRLRDAAEMSPLRDKPDLKRVNEFLVDAYLRYWPGIINATEEV